jgi:type IV pilus assembly protein PilY1
VRPFCSKPFLPANEPEASVNNTPRTAAARPSRMSRLAPLLACIVTVLGLPVHAAVSLPNTPLQTSNGVPPNIWFILDDSGSMASTFMPDDVPDTTPTRIETQTYTRNSIYYNPSSTYRGWQNSDGTFKPDTPYTAVFNDPILVGGGTTSLGGSTQTFYIPFATITDFADSRQYTRYQFLTDGTATKCVWRTTPTTGYDNCTTGVTSFTWPGGITRTLAQEKQNFANWYSYHLTRTKVAKAGASYAFNDPSVFNDDNDYRVGFTTIWQRNEFRIPVNNNGGLFRGNNPGENRRVWFDRLFAAGASARTPLLPALTRAGEYFSETGTNGPWGPQAAGAQFECRQNFSILTTDGFWNDGATAVGNSDATNGTAISGPKDPTYTYTAAAPYKDGWTNTLADVAMHYWKRDLRTDLVNAVPTSASNPAFWQHMVTFGISIGLRGTLDPKTDLPALTSGAKTWPDPTDTEDLERIDDLFHAAVNGHGSFVAAGNPDEFADGLGNALRAISARRGSGSNAAVTSNSTTVGTNVFLAKFFSAKWYGELQAFAFSATGINTNAPVWSASIPAYASRNIFTHNGTAGTTFPTAAQTSALTTDVVNYIRGDRSKEESAGGVFRNRNTLLGTIVNSTPAYVKSPSTVETVYVGANDGMLHAFNAVDGVERFAYVPRGIDLVDLKDYSDPNYGHRFFVDGPIVTSTSSDLANRTVLVGSLGRGGNGLYALDVTDPTIFGPSKVLWDKDASFDSDMGQVLGKPIIAKLNNGSTGVIVPNGLNSTSERAALFVLDLVTGAKIAEIDTGVGSPAATNGLSTPTGWDADGDGTVDIVYAGDFRGNVWKFDLSSSSVGSWGVANNRPLYAPTAAGTQPVTGGVTIAVDPSTDKRWVFFGTGRLLTNSDLTDSTLQTWYGVIDDEAATASVTRAGMTARNIPFIDAVTLDRAFEPNTPLPANSKGWYIDLDLPSGVLEGERMVGVPKVVKNVLRASSIIPNTSNPCQSGRGYINALDAFTGTSLTTGFFGTYVNGVFVPAVAGPGGTSLGSVNGNVGLITDSEIIADRLVDQGNEGLYTGFVNPDLIGGRISWREIIRR